MTPPELRRTPLYEAHLAAGAKMAGFAGWEMPISYRGIRDEHEAVRGDCGIFDVSHMGEIETSGPDSTRLLQRLLSNDVEAVEVGGAQYSCLCREDGGVLDDLFSYRVGEDRWLTVTNASNHVRDLDWFRTHAAGHDVEVVDALAGWAMLAVQGPRARAVIAGLSESELPSRFRTAEVEIAGVEVRACGTGYTGEDGLELLVAAERAPRLWAALVDAGAVPCGLAARDTLRLEVCFHLYGNDLGLERTPIEGGLGWCCKEETGFIGSEAIAAVRESGPSERLVPLRIPGRGIPRQGNPVLLGDRLVGEVTSGTFSPSLQAGIGMAYVSSEHAETGARLEVDVRGTRREAEVGSKPLYEPQPGKEN